MAGAAVPPGVIAEAVAAVKEFARVGGAEEDATTERLVATAIGIGEAFCGQAIVRRGFEDVLTPSGGWQRLGATPVTAIGGVLAVPVASAPVVLPVESYAVDIDAVGDGWVKVAAGAAGRVAVSYTAGLATTWSVVPAPIAQGIVALTAHLLTRHDEGSAPPASVVALWRPFRRMRLAQAVRA